ncbi:hypothetical protein MT325_m778R [Paramecium bursaria chlorella virus MT325]|uniref:Uncharacterized protein m778R n=1 Tax=Paramecium bursaria Chlorella virus MT325 TaxID=346932 RepID=A7IVF8_PBCVM|nr:hypothetical protein MT325_m778R [Paramecium bursaria chlorella virus MT325]
MLCVWSTKAPRSAARSITVFIEISHDVLYTALTSGWMPITFWIDPPLAIIWFFIASDQVPRAMSSRTR